MNIQYKFGIVKTLHSFKRIRQTEIVANIKQEQKEAIKKEKLGVNCKSHRNFSIVFIL